MIVYLVTYQSYEEYDIHGIWTDKLTAEAQLADLIKYAPNYMKKSYWLKEYETDKPLI